MREFQWNTCFSVTKVTVAGYYVIENPLSDIISKSRRFAGLLSATLVGCQEPLVVRMAWKLPLLGGSWGKLR